MPKPGTITAVQVILWIFAALGLIGDVFAVVNLVEGPNPAGVAGLVYAAATTAVSILVPIHLGRGRRWAWIWPLIGSSVGLAMAAFLILGGVANFESSAVPLAAGVASAGLYGSVLWLLCSKSTREWVLVHRIQRGKVGVEALPPEVSAAFAPGWILEMEPGRPARRPVIVTVLQVVVVLIALAPLTTVNASIAEARRDLASRFSEPQLTLAEVVRDEHLPELIFAIVFVLAMWLLAVVSIVGLGRGRSWARIHTPIWIGLTVAASLLWIQLTVDWQHDNEMASHGEILRPALAAMGFASFGAFLLAIAAFFMVLSSGGVHRWTPGPRFAIAAEAGPPSAHQER